MQSPASSAGKATRPPGSLHGQDHSQFIFLIASLPGRADTGASHSLFSYQEVRKHELLPHRRIIPRAGIRSGFNQLRLRLTVSADGRVAKAEPDENTALFALWPEVRDEVLAWKFLPFERDGKAVLAEVDDYITFAPLELSPKRHVTPPILSAGSRIAITLQKNQLLWPLSCLRGIH